MTLDGFLGFLALFIAFYTLMTATARLRAQLHLFVQVPLALVAFALVMYFEFFDVAKQPCRLAAEICSRLVFPADRSFTPQQAAFLVVLAWMVLAWTVNATLRPGPRSLRNMSRIVQSLIQDRRSSDMLDFLEPHLPFIIGIATRRRWTQRLHDWFARGDAPPSLKNRSHRPRTELMLKAEIPVTPAKRLVRWISGCFRRNIRWMAALVPSGAKPQAHAEAILRATLRSDEFRTHLVTLRPDALPAFLAVPMQMRFDFADKVLTALIEDNGSRLYQEIEENQNTSGHGYAIPSENALLHYLFSDAETARALGAWKPVGDAAIEAIKSKQQYRNLLNSAYRDVPKEQWRDIVFVTVRFFDIMVHEAIRQGVADHMWLHYLPIIVATLESMHDETGEGVDRMSEFPTRGSFMIYCAFNAIGGWVGSASALPANSPHLPKPGVNPVASAIIPIEAALALGGAMVTVVLSDRIGDHFKKYIHECALWDIAALETVGAQGIVRDFLVKAILDGGNRHAGRAYVERLDALVKAEDPVLLQRVDDYVQALKARLN